MSKMNLNKSLWAKALLGAMALLMFTESAWAILGVWRRTAVRTAVVVGATESAAAASANANATASKEAAAAANAQSAANASAAAAQQSAAAAQQAAARVDAPPPAPAKTPQQKLAELQSLYDQKLISQSDYQAAKTKILNEMTK
jgi:hypothetical protein